MNKFIRISVAIVIFIVGINQLSAQTHDTITIQTFSFGSPQDSWFNFPSDTVRFEKILMEYTLKCNPAQSPACGEWDYLTYTYLYDHTGFLDSTAVNQPMFLVNGQVRDTISYMNNPTFRYVPQWQYYMTYSDTVSLNSYVVGSGATIVTHPFGSANPVSKSQYLWRASELTSAGIPIGNITGMRFHVSNIGSTMRNLTIRIKQTSLDSLSTSNLIDTGFTLVYSRNTLLLNLGWNTFSFLNPINWNGTSNLIVEVTFDNLNQGTDNIVFSQSTSYPSVLTNCGRDRVVNVSPNGYVNIPVNSSIAAIDTAVTISFWTYGNSNQPLEGTCFEAVDSLGNRLLNAHLPWSDSRVYWDAGFSGTSFDRIDKVATTAQIKEKWNHWTFTKNSNTGLMKIYNNGVLWHSGLAKTKRMQGIKTFLIGKGTWSGAASYQGRMDEFAVFNTELDSISIKQIFESGVSTTGPNASNLAVYYAFDDGNNLSVADSSQLGIHSPAAIVMATNPLKPAVELFKRKYVSSNYRPNIVFEQGVFVTQIDSAFVIDTVMNTPMVIVEFADSVNHPGSVTDSLFVWPTSCNNYVFNALGQAIDSSIVAADAIKILKYYTWYRIFPQVNRFELARYITPYGNGLSLGDGWKWTFDVSDYRTLLADSVHLTAGNWQELLDMKFIMIKGTPPRDVLKIENLYSGGFNYGVASDPIDNHLPAIKKIIASNAVNARWKSRITGHGMDAPENCAEFCAKNHYFKVNNTLQYTKLVWRDNCDLNPLYPQGGTWVYDRANWCPGAEVWTYDMELSSFITPGDTLVLDHDVQDYTSNGPWDYFQIEDQLVTYTAPNFVLDAALENIISPSDDKMFLRQNPICTKPKVIIKNTGSTTLTSLKILYGIEGVTPSVYTWHGNLKFMEIETVNLDTFVWAQGAEKFVVSISEPNGGIDQYSNNNSLKSVFTYPPLLPSQFIIEVKTNNYPAENQYSLVDVSGNTILSRTNLTANTLYRDTVNLADGCYSFLLKDSGEDGLNFWANTAQGAGYARFKKVSNPAVLKNFNADFGGEIYQQFTVGISNHVDDYIFTKETLLKVYPNPTSGKVYINFDFPERTNGEVQILNSFGQQIYKYAFNGVIAESLETDISNFSSGVYFVLLKSNKEVTVRKFVKN